MLRTKEDLPKNIILKLIQDVKLSVFKVIYLVMKNDEQPLLLVFTLSLIQFFQILYFNFSGKLKYIWENDAIADGLFLFLKYFSIAIHLVDQSFELVLIVFYIFFGLLILALLLIIIITLTAKPKNGMAFPILILRVLLKIFLTIGFMPGMGLFFLILTCEDDGKGAQIMYYVPTQQCWVSSHTVHAVFAIIGICLLQGLATVVSMMYFESKNAASDAFSQRNGRSYGYYHYFVTAITTAYILLEVPRFTAVILAISLAGSFLLFYKIHKERPFYNLIIQKTWSVISAVNFWTILLLVFAALLEGSFFQDTIVGWIVGTPLIIFVIIRQPPEEVDLLAANINMATSGSQLIKLCEYMLRLIDESPTDQNASLMLDGYIEIHKQTCPRADCVLKVKKQLSEKFRNNPVYRDRTQILIEIINQIYFYGIKAFPQDVNLRLNYAFFLLDRMKQKQQALAELQQAEQSSPGFDHEFIIYRYKRIIEDDLQEQQQDTLAQVDIVTEIAFQNQSKLLVNAVERSALLHLEFWTQLQEDNPDVGKLSDIGFKIMQVSESVDEQWKRLKRLNNKAYKLNRLMGRYYTQILQDEEVGLKLLHQVKQVDDSQRNRIDNVEDIANEPLATIVIMTEIEKLGVIHNVNKAACSMIGYTKTDLINRKLNVIQPDIYAKFHDNFIESYLDRSDKAEQPMNQKDRLIFVKSKSNYILPCYFNVRIMQTFNQGLYLCASFKQELQNRPCAYLICDLHGTIENLSSGCIKLLGLELRQIQLKPTTIQEYFPEILDRKEEYMIKGGAPITLPQSMGELESYLLQCQITEIQFSLLQNENLQNKVFGYVMKFERVSLLDRSMLEVKKKNANPYQFYFNPGKQQYLLEMSTVAGSLFKVDQSILWEDNTKISNDIVVTQQNQSVKAVEQVFNYGEGIKTVRLWNERIVEIEDVKSEDDEELEELQRSVFQKAEQAEQVEEGESDNNNLFRSKQQLEFLIKQSRLPQVIKNYKILIDLVILLLIVSSYAYFFVGSQQIAKISDQLPLLSKSNNQVGGFLLAQSIYQDFFFYNNDYYPIFKSQVGGTFLATNNDLLQRQLTILQEQQIMLALAEIELGSAYQKYQAEFKAPLVTMRSIDGATLNYTYNEAVQQLIAKALSLSKIDISQFNLNNSDLHYYLYNTFNALIVRNYIPSNYYYYNLVSQNESIRQTITAFLAAGTSVLVILVVVLSLYFLHVQALNLTILTLFLDINEKNVKLIYKKCENFITSLQIGEDEEALSDNEDKDEENDPEVTLLQRKKRRKHKNSSMAYRNYFFGLLFVILLLEGYYVVLFISSEQAITSAQKLTPLLNLTSFVESYYRFTDNVLRQYLFDPSYPVFDQDSGSTLQGMLKEIYDIDASIHQLHTHNIEVLEQDYLDAFNQIQIVSPCDVLEVIDPNLANCRTWENGVLEQGLSIAMTKYFESLRGILTSYQAVQGVTYPPLPYNLTTDERLNYAMNLLNTQQATSIRRMSKIIIRAAYSYLIQRLEDSVQDRFSQVTNTRIALFVSFNIFMFVVYFLVWLPLYYKICNDTLKIRGMLTMIPLNLILSVRTLKTYIRRMINN